MQVAAFLSDLRSLSVCSHEAAIGLVQAHQEIRYEEASNMNTSAPQVARDPGKSLDLRDADLQRADELVSLHHDVKLRHMQNGQDQELLSARHAVRSVLASLTRPQ